MNAICPVVCTATRETKATIIKHRRAWLIGMLVDWQGCRGGFESWGGRLNFFPPNHQFYVKKKQEKGKKKIPVAASQHFIFIPSMQQRTVAQQQDAFSMI